MLQIVTESALRESLVGLVVVAFILLTGRLAARMYPPESRDQSKRSTPRYEQTLAEIRELIDRAINTEDLFVRSRPLRLGRYSTGRAVDWSDSWSEEDLRDRDGR